jgi:hypothetical protein
MAGLMRRISRRDKQNGVKHNLIARTSRYGEMTEVNGIERSAEKPDSPEAAPWDRYRWSRAHQERLLQRMTRLSR